MKTRNPLITALLAGSLLLSGCAASAGEAVDEADQVAIVLDWTPNTNHTGIYVALDQGYYEQAGIELEILGYSQAGVESVMGTGGAEFGFSGVDSLAAAQASGLELTMVMNVQQKSSFGVAVRDDSAIGRPADLDGRTLAAYGAGATNFNTKQIIIADGGVGDFERIVVGTGALEAVVARRADFAEAMATWEVLAQEQQGTGIRMFFPADFGVPTTPALLGISVRDDFMAANSDAVRRFVRATQQGYEFAVNDPDQAAQILVDANPQAKLDPTLTMASQRLLSSEYWPDEQGSVGHADVQRWQSYLDHLVLSGLLVDADGQPVTTPFEAADLVTNEFLA